MPPDRLRKVERNDIVVGGQQATAAPAPSDTSSTLLKASA